MIPELGHFALILALCVALVQSTVPMIGAARGDQAMINFARPSAYAQFLCVAVAFAILTYAFLANDFSVAYTARNSNTALPTLFPLFGVPMRARCCCGL